MKFWHWLGVVVLLLIMGNILYRLVYTLRTGHDLETDRRAAMMAAMANRRTAQAPTIAGSGTATAQATTPATPAPIDILGGETTGGTVYVTADDTDDLFSGN